MGRVKGKCPMGCGETLHVSSSSGVIDCVDPGCPMPGAVTELLKDPQTVHNVRVDPTGFAIQHPMAERIGLALFDCDLQVWLEALHEAPVSAGLYRVEQVDEDHDGQVIGGWHFEGVEETES